ncbi:MAG: hypothetical protein KC441_16645 [Anaerolineales bacterium]|nr:hypothetical protein [Anaerolineales bacterium]
MTVHQSKNGKPKCGAWGRFLYLETAERPANCRRCLGQVKRRPNRNTVNRGWLKRQILAGRVIAKCNYYHTDDYAFDAAVNFRQSGWLKARIEDDYGQRAHNGECLYFTNSDFRGYGHAWREANDDIVLSFGFRSYTLRLTS